ncbi:MAG: hypothetical protein IH840_15620 [Candidatus Heimdallarchaeota archaeon]|nr:hypothetical protein [Candidatus Heimdallarchaeota archaeon]
MVTQRILIHEPIRNGPSNKSIAYYFLDFLKKTFTPETWTKLLEDPEFVKFKPYLSAYGDTVFQPLVNLALKFYSGRIQSILKNFSKFYQDRQQENHRVSYATRDIIN